MHEVVVEAARVAEQLGETVADARTQLGGVARRMQTLNLVSRQQIALLRRFRESGGDRTQEEQLSALLLSINTIAAGFGATGSRWHAARKSVKSER